MAKQDKNTNTPTNKAAAPNQEKVTPRKSTKKSQLIDLLSAGKSVSLDKLSSALGWQRHTTSAAMTRLKQDGHALVSEKEHGGTRLYRIATPKIPLLSKGAKQADDDCEGSVSDAESSSK